MILRSVHWVTQEREFQTTGNIENLKWECVWETTGQHSQNRAGEEIVKREHQRACQEYTVT